MSFITIATYDYVKPGTLQPSSVNVLQYFSLSGRLLIWFQQHSAPAGSGLDPHWGPPHWLHPAEQQYAFADGLKTPVEQN